MVEQDIPGDECPLPFLSPSRSSTSSWSIVSQLTRTRLTLGLWLIAALLDLLIAFSGGGSSATIMRVATTYSAGVVISLAALSLLPRSAAGVTEFSLVRILLVAIPSGAALFVVDVFGRAFAHGQSPFQSWPTPYFLRLRHNLAYFTMLFVFQSTFTWLMAAAQALERRERQLLEARLVALRLQLNPHFLFNTLSAIMTLVNEAGAAEAEQMIQRLSDFLQASLVEEASILVPLAAEIDMVQAYLEIEAVRFRDRLVVRYACEPGLDEARVPNFILQPLIENAVKHAVAVSKELVTISIEAKADGGDLILSVQDQGGQRSARVQSPGGGLGLRNVAARLETLYGSAGRITASPRDSGFAAVLRFPLRLVA